MKTKRCGDILRWEAMVLLSVFAISTAGCEILDPQAEGNLVPNTVIEDTSLPRFVASDGTVLHLRTYGSAQNPAVLVFHGGPGQDMRAYEALIQLSNEYHVVMWDQRGAGLSQRVNAASITGEAYLQDVRDIVAEYSSGEPVFLIGHSWGGAYATYVTQQMPEIVRGLVLIEPMEMTREAFQRHGDQSTNLLSRGINRVLAAADRTRPDSHAEADYLYQAVVAELDSDGGGPPAVGTTARRTGYVAWRTTVEWLGFLSGKPYDGFDFLSGVRTGYQGRTLIIASDDDFLGIELQREFHAPHFADVQVIEVTGADHYMLVDPSFAPSIMAEIKSFLEAL